MTLAEGQGKMSRDDRGLSERQSLGNRHAVDGGDLHELRIASPTLNAKHLSFRAAAMVSTRAVRAAAAAHAAEDGDTVVDLHLLDTGSHFDDNTRWIAAQDQGQGHAVVAAVLSDLQVERAVDGDRVDPDQDLTGAGDRRGNLLPPERVRAAELPDDDGLQFGSFPGAATREGSALATYLSTRCRVPSASQQLKARRPPAAARRSAALALGGDASLLRQRRASFTVIARALHCVGILGKTDNRMALRAAGRAVAWWILQLDEVVLVRAVVDIHLRLDIFAALLAVAPITGVFFGGMVAAEGIAPMVSGAAIPGIGKDDVTVLVVTDPLAAARGPREFPPLAAQATTSTGGLAG
jgi:hypothetical protein